MINQCDNDDIIISTTGISILREKVKEAMALGITVSVTKLETEFDMSLEDIHYILSAIMDQAIVKVKQVTAEEKWIGLHMKKACGTMLIRCAFPINHLDYSYGDIQTPEINEILKKYDGKASSYIESNICILLVQYRCSGEDKYMIGAQ